MQQILKKVAFISDQTNSFVGKSLSWLVPIMVALMFISVVQRYLLNTNLIWQQELIIFIHAVLFLACAGYTLLNDKHVRVDVFYQKMSSGSKAMVDFVGTVVFLIPVCLTIQYFATDFIVNSWKILESSSEYNGMPGVFILKTFIWVFTALLILQGISTSCKFLSLHKTKEYKTKMVKYLSLLVSALLLISIIIIFPTYLALKSSGITHNIASAYAMSFFMLIALIILLLYGFPVAFVLAGVSLILAFISANLDIFDTAYIAAIPNRIYGIMTNDLLVAVPLFVFMGTMLERAQIAEEMLNGMSAIMGKVKCGLGVSVMLVGTLLAASTGIVGATVVTMGLISLPVMLKNGYNNKIATGSICAAGTLGQIIPPSIVLILLGDQISSAHQITQLEKGNLAPNPVSIADLFIGALAPGILLVILYIIWLIIYGTIYPQEVPPTKRKKNYPNKKIINTFLPPFLLIVIVLGSILAGIATATESASIGAVGAILLAAFKKRISLKNLKEAADTTTQISAMVFTILIGAAVFTLVFRGFGGDYFVHNILTNLPGGLFTVMLLTMILIFLLGFFLDFIEIIYVVIPIIAPILLSMGANPVWLAIMIAINLQTSFLTPPFGFALFYLRGTAPTIVPTSDIYKGVIPFVAIQLLVMIIISIFPDIATILPEYLYGSQFDNIIPTSSYGNSHNYGVDF